MNFDWPMIDRSLLHLFNGWAGHWRLLDGLAAHTLANDLLKAGLVGACLMVAWCRGGTAEQVRDTRRILLATLLAAVMALSATKFLCHQIVLPRPYLRDAHVLLLDGRTLVPCQPLDCRTGLDGRSQERRAALLDGSFPPGDWSAFPSDHAAFFVVLSLGLIAAWPVVGWPAMAWTALVILGSKMMLGLHSPLEIMGGALIGAVSWIAVRGLLEVRPGRWLDRLADWCSRNHGWSTALFFLAAFEITSTLSHVDEILTAVAKLR